MRQKTRQRRMARIVSVETTRGTRTKTDGKEKRDRSPDERTEDEARDMRGVFVLYNILPAEICITFSSVAVPQRCRNT